MISFSQFTTNSSTTKITIDSKFENNRLKHCFLTSSSITRTYFSCLGPFSSFFFLWYTKEHSKRLPKHSTSVLRTLATTTLRLPMSVIWKLDNFKTLIRLLIRFFLFYYQPTGRCCIKLPVLFTALYSAPNTARSFSKYVQAIKTITRNTSGDRDDHNRLVRTVVKILMG